MIIEGGRVVAQGSPAELKARTSNDVLELHTSAPGALFQAVAVLRRLGIGEVSVDADTSRCSIPTPLGSGVLPIAVRALDDAGVQLEDVTLRHPTLDEVFLALTAGRKGA